MFLSEQPLMPSTSIGFRSWNVGMLDQKEYCEKHHRATVLHSSGSQPMNDTYSYRESISTTKKIQTSPLKEDFNKKWKTAENRLALRLSKMESRWVCFFMETALEKCNIPSLDALQWMGAVRMRVQTADKNITIINKQFTWLQSSN